MLYEKRQKLFEEMHLLSGEINRRKWAHESAGKLKSEFARKQKEYEQLSKRIRLNL